MPGTAESGTWLVTRAFQRPSSTLNSRASPVEADGARREQDLVVVAGLGELHGALVEGRERHRMRRARLGERQGREVVLLGVDAAGARNLPPLDRLGIEVAEIDEQRTRRGLRQGRVGSDDVHVERDFGDAGAILQHAAIADDDEARRLAHVIERQQLGCQLRADAGGVSHRQGDRWLPCALARHVVASSRSVSSQKRLASVHARAQYRRRPGLPQDPYHGMAPARHAARLARHARAARAQASRRPHRGRQGRRAVGALVHDHS